MLFGFTGGALFAKEFGRCPNIRSRSNATSKSRTRIASGAERANALQANDTEFDAFARRNLTPLSPSKVELFRCEAGQYEGRITRACRSCNTLVGVA
jgi:hypothetical protein